jgi:hypothetical protein
VAIGVGFAGRLALMNWLIGGYSPSGDDLRQLARLLTAMFVIVLSWDWYARDIGRYPLKRILRFLVDVAIIESLFCTWRFFFQQRTRLFGLDHWS